MAKKWVGMAEQIAKTPFTASSFLHQIFYNHPPTHLFLDSFSFLQLLLYPFSDSICIALARTSRPYRPCTVAISIAAMLTQLHLKNAPKFVSLFAAAGSSGSGGGGAARENMSKISKEKMEKTRICLRLPAAGQGRADSYAYALCCVLQLTPSRRCWGAWKYANSFVSSAVGLDLFSLCFQARP